MPQGGVVSVDGLDQPDAGHLDQVVEVLPAGAEPARRPAGHRQQHVDDPLSQRGAPGSRRERREVAHQCVDALRGPVDSSGGGLLWARGGGWGKHGPLPSRRSWRGRVCRWGLRLPGGGPSQAHVGKRRYSQDDHRPARAAPFVSAPEVTRSDRRETSDHVIYDEQQTRGGVALRRCRHRPPRRAPHASKPGPRGTHASAPGPAEGSDV